MAAKGGEGCAPELDENLMEKVGKVVQELLAREYIKANRHIPTAELLKGLPMESSEREIRKHIYSFYQ
jgi:hypothetical protein